MSINEHLGIGEDEEGNTFLVINDNHLNRNGVAHGGVLCTLADWAMASKVLQILPPHQTTATIDLTTKYLRPVAANDSIKAHVVLTNQNRKLITLECALKNGVGKDVSKSYATFMVLEKVRKE